MKTEDNIIIEKAIKFHFFSSNNEAEYEPLIQGLRLNRELGALEIQVYSDFVSQVEGEYKAWEESMISYKEEVLRLSTYSIRWS